MKVPPLDYPTSEVRRELDRLRHPFRIAVTRFKNPFNIGAVIRTAHSFLAREIILIGDEPFYKRAAMGMDKYENLVMLPDENAFIELARREGWPIVAFEKDSAREGLWEVELADDCVLVLGNEDDGVPAPILEAADHVVGIPMYGINHSYPVSVSAGIAMAEWVRRRYQGGRVVLPERACARVSER